MIHGIVVVCVIFKRRHRMALIELAAPSHSLWADSRPTRQPNARRQAEQHCRLGKHAQHKHRYRMIPFYFDQLKRVGSSDSTLAVTHTDAAARGNRQSQVLCSRSQVLIAMPDNGGRPAL